MICESFVAYYRVSTVQQGKSGLGLDAQRKDVTDYLNGRPLLASFTEVESGAKVNRIELEKALELARKHKATLVIAKLDRLARNVHFISGLMQQKVKFVACDLPTVSPFMLHIHAAVAEEERRMIGARTKAALDQAKLRGVNLGGIRPRGARLQAEAQSYAETLRPVIQELRQLGATTAQAIASGLTERGIVPTCGRWHPQTVKRLLSRLSTPSPSLSR